MAELKVIEARRHMCGKMSRLLRLEHHEASVRVGVDPHRGLREVYDASYLRRALLIDGELAALGGVIGTMLDPYGFVWLSLSQKATRHPIALVKEARKQLTEIMLTKQELVTTVIDGDSAARRLALFLGFHVADRGFGAPAFSHHGRRLLARYIDDEPEFHVPAGGGSFVKLGYHATENG